jgi:hypothetical protein
LHALKFPSSDSCENRTKNRLNWIRGIANSSHKISFDTEAVVRQRVRELTARFFLADHEMEGLAARSQLVIIPI